MISLCPANPHANAEAGEKTNTANMTAITSALLMLLY
jgi:hypothetical protein